MVSGSGFFCFSFRSSATRSRFSVHVSPTRIRLASSKSNHRHSAAGRRNFEMLASQTHLPAANCPLEGLFHDPRIMNGHLWLANTIPQSRSIGFHPSSCSLFDSHCNAVAVTIFRCPLYCVVWGPCNVVKARCIVVLVSPLQCDYERLLLAASTFCLLYTSPSPRDGLLSRMPSSA